MNELVVNDNSEIGNMIFAVRGKQVIIDKEISRTKCHNYFYDMMITHYDVGQPMSAFNNFIIGGKIIWN